MGVKSRAATAKATKPVASAVETTTRMITLYYFSFVISVLI
jgi:hypothetical protein